MSRKTTRKTLHQPGSARLFRHLTPDEIAEFLPSRDDSAIPPAGPEAIQRSGMPAELKAIFLGPEAENAELVEKMLLQVFRDQVFWRRNFHPEDMAVIQPEDQESPLFHDFLARFERELFTLLGELKADIPFYSPRYLGHMLADISLPSLIGYIATMFYNPNNVSWEASPVTTLIEVEVGRQLARMLGFGQSAEELARTWGHITSGGTVANVEAMWVAKALKFLPIAIRNAAGELDLQGLRGDPAGKPIEEMSAWELVNISPTQALDLKDRFIAAYVEKNRFEKPEEAAARAMEKLKAQDILTLGDQAFFSRLRGNDELGMSLIFAPQTMHYSWNKGAGAVGIGAANVIPIPVDSSFRMDIARLKEQLMEAVRARNPVLMVVGVVGSTEEGAVDPIREIVSLREEMTRRGLSFGIHCDAAYGGYVAACFRSPDGQWRKLPDMQAEYGGWPAPEVYNSFAALGSTDSVTVDPHKLGYVPYPAGAVIFRDARCKELVAQEAAYALGVHGHQHGEFHIGRYILEGSKAGAAAAASFLSHRVIPLDQRGYGKLLGYTAEMSRIFHQRLLAFADTVRDEFIVEPLVLPDTNVVCYAFNLVGNNRLDRMNRFSEAIYRELSIDPDQPVQTRRFIVSRTEFSHAKYNPALLKDVLEKKFRVCGRYLVSSEELKAMRERGTPGYEDEMMVFISTLMNPFLLEKVRGNLDYLDLFLEDLPGVLRSAREAISRSPSP